MIEERIPVLVAEDSEDNRFLLRAYCRGTSYDLTFAENGAKAVEAYRGGSFDMVIMDVQMPVMDGLSATRLIRGLEAERGNKRTPILALSANVMPQDILLALEAGCDLHLPKPISRKGFLTALEQWKPNTVNAASIRIEIQPGLEQLALSYLATRQRELTLFEDLLRRSAFEELKRLAHNLKGTGTSYGFPELTNIGAALEIAAKNHDTESLNENVASLAAYLKIASQHLRKMS